MNLLVDERLVLVTASDVNIIVVWLGWTVKLASLVSLVISRWVDISSADVSNTEGKSGKMFFFYYEMEMLLQPMELVTVTLSVPCLLSPNPPTQPIPPIPHHPSGLCVGQALNKRIISGRGPRVKSDV